MFPELRFTDPSARNVISFLKETGEEYLKDRFGVYGSIARTMVFRSVALSYFAATPEGTVVNLGCGLSDYFQWLVSSKRSWVDFDLPEVIEIRRKLLKPLTPNHRTVAGSLTDKAWWDLLGLPVDRPVHLMSEGVSMYLHPEEIRQVIGTFAHRAPVGSTFVFDHMCWLAAGRARKHPSVKNTQAEFHWGLRRYSELTSIDPRLKVREVHRVMEPYGLPFSVVGPVFRALTGVPFYGITVLEKTSEEA